MELFGNILKKFQFCQNIKQYGKQKEAEVEQNHCVHGGKPETKLRV